MPADVARGRLPHLVASDDGFGHQLETRLSCITTAASSTRLQYVHTPSSAIEHGECFAARSD